MKQLQVQLVSDLVDWTKIPSVEIDYRLKDRPTDVRAFAQICRTDTALLLRMYAFEEEIRAEETGRNGIPCNDSCLEFFFSPHSDENKYFNIEINPNGCMYLGIGTNVHNLIRLVFEEDAQQESIFKIQTEQSNDYWCVTYQIPYWFIREFFPKFTPDAGTQIRANFYKCADLSEKPHYLAWNPIYTKKPGAFHTPEEFGLLEFI